MRKTESTLNVIWGLLVRIVLVAVLVWIVWKIKSVLITVVLAAMLTYVLLPAVEFLCARRFIPYISRRGQRLIASVLVFAAFFFVVGLGVKILIAPIKIETENFIRSVPEYNARLQESIEDVQDWYTKNVPEDWQEFIGEQDFRDVGSGIGKQLGSVIKSTVEWLGNILE
ncbi:MAG TPA: AI-2E family transporter, partial [Armatimonadota bacterium]|nr:AI-2E family transporter [Armatimonadota bacterium]